ncbi:hypothetical protein EMIHUDRAFT_450032 [Emiliania huxleyi CCMP1516]|uniref:Uncharacterized protein n=2 Tax=Emiliania huxleyi TaxID=2903 RepID=A0A0D3JYJ0_EMIH1|nr:hypothetical protein EMIHUDRAFT_450032 [Emiliania huxleyi CCMP1516]EOD28575.1 hypothetical protein EMIHUDRAFT_450032 [Emiliania huxleyi CCMP1516]|eukprot:XP_005781004.1 hypothetical protein EMIHUDRAFT_450032 [Emiliania huxleyi CCMP1516]
MSERLSSLRSTLSTKAASLSEKAAKAAADSASRLGESSVGKSLREALEEPDKVRELLREKNRRIQELERDLESVKARAVAKFRDLSQQKAALEEAIGAGGDAALVARARDLEETLSRERERSQRLERRATELEQEARPQDAALGAAMVEAKRQLAESEFTSAIAALTTENASVESRLSKEARAKDKAKGSASQLKEEREKLRSELAALKAELAGASKAARESEQLRLQLHEERRRVSDATLPALEPGSEPSDVALAALNQELVSARLGRAESDAALAEARREVARTREELYESRTRAEQREAEHAAALSAAAELKKAAAVLAAENASVEGKLHKEVEKVDKAKEALKVGIAERKQLQAEVKALEARLSTTSRDEQKSQGRLSSAAEVNRELSSERDTLAAQLKKASRELEALQATRAKEVSAAEQLRQGLDRAQAEARSASEDSSAAVQALRTKVGAFERELGKTKSLLAQKELQLSTMSADNLQKLEAERDELSATAAGLRDQLEEARSAAQGWAPGDSWVVNDSEFEAAPVPGGDAAALAIADGVHLSTAEPARSSGAQPSPGDDVADGAAKEQQAELQAEVQRLQEELASLQRRSQERAVHEVENERTLRRLEQIRTLKLDLAAAKEEIAALKKGEQSRTERAAALKEKTQAYVSQLRADHAAALDAAAADGQRALEAKQLELERFEAAAADEIATAQMSLEAAERTAGLEASSVRATLAAEAKAQIRTMSREIREIERQLQAEGG